MTDAPDLAAAGVTDREAEVLTLLGEQLSHLEIAGRLFISVRTVESHAKSLRQKLGLADRRALMQLAVECRMAEVKQPALLRPSRLPKPLTSFVGRGVERTALAEELAASRLVTAVGPAGVGKTRLSLAVASDVSERFADGVFSVDLAEVTEPVMVTAAVLTALGLSDVTGQTAEDALVNALTDRNALLLLDNAEHLVNSVAVLVERLLAECPELVVLVTSRVRLVVPFEKVYPVPGLSLPDPERGDGGDALALFVARAGAAGHPPPTPDERQRIAVICEALEGTALAIELAAARLPSLGFNGLEQGLADLLELLTGGPRLHSRHRSLQNALGWSYQLLEPVDQAVLRRVSTFAAPFSAAAATEVASFDEVHATQVAASLARLVDSSLLVTVAVPGGGDTRYRALESVRQYGTVQIDAAGDHEALARHLRWCITTATELVDPRPSDPDAWRDTVDAVANDLRAALGWAATRSDQRDAAHDLGATLAHLLFLRGRLGEAQRRYEQAADLADDPMAASISFARAAAMAKCRTVGDDALRLHRAAAEAARRAGDRPGTAIALARGAELIGRWRGMFAELPPAGTAEALLDEARREAGDHPRAEAAILTAALFADDEDPGVAEKAARVIELAQRLGDPMIESAARDALTGSQFTHGDIVDAAATARHRIDGLIALVSEPEAAIELKDATHVAVYASIGAGDLPGARRAAELQLGLSFLREERHLANEELLAPDALAGVWDRVLLVSEQFRDSWERAGRPCAPGRGMAPCSVAMVHGLRGDDQARADWLAVLAAIRGVEPSQATKGCGYGEVFDAVVVLHHDGASDARAILSSRPATRSRLYGPVFRQWTSALLAEAAVLAKADDATALITAAENLAARNPIATSLVDRARALHTDDRAGLLAAARKLADAGCNYQMARTLVFAGGDEQRQGDAALARMGAAPMTGRS